MEAGRNDIKIYIAGYLNSLQTAITSAKSQIQSMSTTFASSAASMLRTTSESMRRIGNTLVGAAGSAMVGFVYPIVSGFKDIISTGLEMEDSIQHVMSVFDGLETPKAFAETKEQLEGFIGSLAGTTIFEFNEIADGIYSMAQAGKSFNEITATTPAILELAIAQMRDIDSTTELVISTMNAYNFSADEVTRVTNAMAAANSATLLTMEDMSVAAQYLNTTIATLWGNDAYERGLALTGMLRDMGYTGQKSGRILRDIFLSLMNPTAEVQRILENNNITIYKNSDAIDSLKKQYIDAEKQLDSLKSSGSATTEMIENQELRVKTLGYELENTYATGLKSLDEVLEAFAKARTEGLTTGELFAIGGKQSGGAFTAIIDDLPKYYDYVDAITDTNEATKQAEIINKSASAQVKMFNSAIIQLKKDLFDGLKESLIDVVIQIKELIPKIKEIGDIFISEFVNKIRFVIDKLIGLVNWFDSLSSGSKKLIAAIVATVAAVGLITTPLMLLTGILSWNIASIITLGEKLLLLPVILSGVTTNATLLNASFANSRVITTYSSLIEILTIKYKNYSTTLKLALYNTESFAIALGLLKTKITKFPFVLLDTMKLSIKSLGDSFGTARFKMSLFGSNIRTVFSGGILTTLAGGLGTVATTLTGTVIPAVLAATAAALPWILIIGTIIAATVLLYVAVRDNWQGIGDIWNATIGEMVRMAKPLLDAIDNVKGAFGNLFDALKSGTEFDIVSGLGEIIGSVVRIIGSIPYTITTALGDILGTVAKILGEWFASVGKDAADKGIDVFLYELASALINGAIELGISFFEGFIKGVTGASNDENKAKVKEAVTISKEEIYDSGKESGKALAEGFIEGVTESEEPINSIMTTLIDGFEKTYETKPAMYDEMSTKYQQMIDEINRTNYVGLPKIGDIQAELFGTGQDVLTEYNIRYQKATEKNNKIREEEVAKIVAYWDKRVSINAKGLKLLEEHRANVKKVNDQMRIEQQKAQKQSIDIATQDTQPAHSSTLKQALVSNFDPTTVDATVISALNETATEDSVEITEAAKPIGTVVGKGIVEGIDETAPEVENSVVTGIYDTTETTMQLMITSAMTWGEQFVISLVSGINNRYATFVSKIEEMKMKMAELQFMANPEEATNARLITSIDNLTNKISTSSGAGMNLTINITGNTFDNGTNMDAEDIGDLVNRRVISTLNSFNRSVVI